MINGKSNITTYCKRMSKVDIEHVQDCIENLAFIENGEISKINGCPMNFGLDGYIGLCELEEVLAEDQYSQCEECWNKALNN